MALLSVDARLGGGDVASANLDDVSQPPSLRVVPPRRGAAWFRRRQRPRHFQATFYAGTIRGTRRGSSPRYPSSSLAPGLPPPRTRSGSERRGETTTSNYKTNSRLSMVNSDSWSNILCVTYYAVSIAINSEDANFETMSSGCSMRPFQSKHFHNQRRLLSSMDSTWMDSRSKQRERERAKRAVRLEVSWFFFWSTAVNLGLVQGFK